MIWLVTGGFVAGVAIGVASAAGIGAFGRNFVNAVTNRRRAGAAGLHVLRYPVIAAALYLALGPLGLDPVALAIGYGLTMAVAMSLLMRQSRVKSEPCPANRPKAQQ